MERKYIYRMASQNWQNYLLMVGDVGTYIMLESRKERINKREKIEMPREAQGD